MEVIKITSVGGPGKGEVEWFFRNPDPIRDWGQSTLAESCNRAGFATDLAEPMQMLMNGGTYGGVRYLRAQTVALFTGRRDATQARGLGWDFVSTTGYTSAGKYFGPSSYGHTGYTGTSVWADPGKKIFVILLANRVYPTRKNEKIRGIRPAVHDAVMRAIGPR